MITSRSINDLVPELQSLCIHFIEACHKAGIDLIITSTYRDFEAQDALYAQGRTTGGKRVTNAKSGESMHNYRVAFDFVPLVNGKPCWDDTKLFEHCGTIAELCGLEWGGRWKSFHDTPHCQWTNGLTLADFKSGKHP